VRIYLQGEKREGATLRKKLGKKALEIAGEVEFRIEGSTSTRSMGAGSRKKGFLAGNKTGEV